MRGELQAQCTCRMLRRYNALETRASARPLRLIVATSARALLEDKKGDFDHLSPKAVVIAGVKAAALQVSGGGERT